MCKSMAEGGQRCVSHATERMLRAQGRYETALAAAADPHATAAESAAARQKAAAAFEKFDEARIDYASTPQGEEDLRNRLAAVLAGSEVAPGVTPSGKPIDNAVDLETAILAGAMVRKRNEQRARRYREARAMAALGDLRDGDVLTVNVGTADMDGRAFLPKGAHVRARVGPTGAHEGMVMVQRVRAPGEDAAENTGQYGPAHAGQFYLVSKASLAHPSDGDAAAEYLRANPEHVGPGDSDDGFWDGTDDSLTAASGF